jgi:hypothetical protein
MCYLHKLGTIEKMDSEWCRMFHNEPNPHIDRSGVDRDLNFGTKDIGLSAGYDFSLYLGSTVPEVLLM